MPRYVWNGSTLVEVPADLPRPERRTPYIQSDLPAYRSPLGAGWIEGRAARREEMKRHNVREVDPSEKPRRPVEPDWVNDWRVSRGIERTKPE